MNFNPIIQKKRHLRSYNILEIIEFKNFLGRLNRTRILLGTHIVEILLLLYWIFIISYAHEIAIESGWQFWNQVKTNLFPYENQNWKIK